MSPLLSPVPFSRGLRAKNRVALAPMTNQQSLDDGRLGDDELRWLLSRADGGFGMVFTCASHVSADGQGWPNELGCFSDQHSDGLRRVADGLRERGAASILQIFHGGARVERSVVKQPWSAMADNAPDGGVRAGDASDLARVISDFAAAADRASRAGFDGVEIHGAHGYLLTQFLSQTNTRTDGWGGDFAARTRLLREVTRAVRAATPTTFTVGVRLSAEDFGNARGLDLDESVEVAAGLKDDGVDFVHVSLWDALQNSKKRPAEHPLPLFRRALGDGVRLITAGSVWTREEGEFLLEKGADVVALGRAAIVNPHWPDDIKNACFVPRRPPVTLPELEGWQLSPRFASYMSRWKGFVVPSA